MNTNEEYIENKLQKATANYGSISYSVQDRGRNLLGSNNVRSGFNRNHYNYYRPSEAIPDTILGSIEVCNRFYRETPFVRSIVDMMADFTVAGIRISHRNPQIQNFLNDWSKFVGFKSFSERIANMLYRTSNCPIKLVYGKIPFFTEKEWKRSSSDIIIQKDKQYHKRIPLKYEILNPLSIDVIGEDISPFIGEPVYGLRLPSGGNYDVERMKEIAKKYQLNISIPDLKPIHIDGNIVIPLNKENFRYLFYKKDDWCSRAWPMIHAVLDPLLMLEKMHLADKKALDGAISQIRLWTLGNFEFKIYPSPASINKLRDVLSNIGNGDTMDVIWGPELTFKETEPKGHQFLGSDKYEQVMAEIYAGLGVPSSLRGSGSNEGYNNSSISMKALVERLEYGRNIIISFWEEQLKIIQKAFGWKYPAVISFDHKVMSDETLERKILLDLWDRDIISTERLRQLCREDPILEELRIRKEKNKIKNGKIPLKASPYHRPSIEDDLKKIIMQSGGVAPSELGIELLPKKEGEKTPLELKAKNIPKNNINNTQPKGTPGEGRPLGVKDSTKRTRTEKPRVAVAEDRNNFISLFNWANEAQEKINSELGDFFLLHNNKKNLRSLNKIESQEFEKLKLFSLCNIKPYEEINSETISRTMSGKFDDDILYYINYLNKVFVEKNDRDPTLTELRQIQSTAFALKYEEENKLD